MIEQDYIVLRSTRPLALGEGVRGEPAGPAALGVGMEAMRIEEASLSAEARADLSRDPRTRAIAAAMPMKLIVPMDSENVAGPAATEATWGVRAVRATESAFTGAGITVAVLDTGIDPDHAAFEGVALEQKNFTTESDDDRHGHGTHCAGTIFGQDVENLRIGVARGVDRALIGKVLGARGGSSATIAKAIQWAVTEGSHVISMSLGIDFPGFVDELVNDHGLDINPATSIALEQYRANINLFDALAEAVHAQGAFGQGTVIVAASGNESNRPGFEIAVAPPAAGSGVIAVGALRQGPGGLSVATFSNNQVDVAAPGVGVISARLGGGLVSKSGTSMATPHAAGVAALWAQKLLETTGAVESQTLTAQLIARAETATLVPDALETDVGTGLVQAPSN